MSKEPARADELLAAVGAIRAEAAVRDRRLCRAGVGLMVVGALLTIAAYFKSSGSDSALDQNDAHILALIGLTAAVIGVGVFLRYSFGEFLRFWLARALVRGDEIDDG